MPDLAQDVGQEAIDFVDFADFTTLQNIANGVNSQHFDVAKGLSGHIEDDPDRLG